jgi:hypothetical protein
VLKSNLVKGFHQKYAVLGDFSIKKEELPLFCGGVFVYSCRLVVIYDY